MKNKQNKQLPKSDSEPKEPLSKNVEEAIPAKIGTYIPKELEQQVKQFIEQHWIAPCKASEYSDTEALREKALLSKKSPGGKKPEAPPRALTTGM